MKALFLFLLVVLSSILSCSQPSQSGVPIFSISNGKIISDSRFVDDFYDSQRADTLTYTTAASTPINVQVGNAVYTVRTARFIDWEDALGDPGYNVIEISKNDQVVFTHKQMDALTDFYDYTFGGFDNLYGQSLRPFSNNNFFIEAPLSNEATALFFAGWPYGTSPAPQLLIIVVTPNDVQIVLNKNLNINSVVRSGYNFSMVVQSRFVEWLDFAMTKPVNEAVLHTIFQHNGVLYFKDN